MTLRSFRLPVAAGVLIALAACGADDPDAADAADPDAAGAADAADASGAGGAAPEACASAYPLAAPSADLADVTLRPADFPEPPVEAVLCQTSSTMDGNITSAEYATEASASEVLDGYEQALAAFEVLRTDEGAGEILTGDLGDGVFVQVTPRPGAYSVAFGTE